MKKEIIEILNRNLLSNRAEALQKLCDESEIFCNYIDKIASEILELHNAEIAKYQEWVEMQEELLEIDRNGFAYIEKNYGRLPVYGNGEIEQAIKRGAELRQKINQLKTK